MLYSARLNSLLVLTKKHHFLEIRLPDDAYLEDYEHLCNNFLDHNIKRRFLQESDEATLAACIKQVGKNDLLAYQKVNMFTAAAAMGNYDALKVAAQSQDMWMGIDGQTLIQLCSQRNDLDGVQVCLQKLADGQGSINWQTLCLLIKSPKSDLLTEVLDKRQVVAAEFTAQAAELLPIRAQITERVHVSKDRFVTPELIEKVSNSQVSPEKLNKIVMWTLCTEVNLVLGSQTCIEALRMLADATEENLSNPHTAMYVEALWNYNWRAVFAYSTLNVL